MAFEIYLKTLLLIVISTHYMTSNATNTGIDDKKISDAINAAFVQSKKISEGKNANYIPALINVPEELFSIAIVTPSGKVFSQGDATYRFTIQSISKVFTLAHVVDNLGPRAINNYVGVCSTGQKFNSLLPLEQHSGKGVNPFVNAGAIATTSLVRGTSFEKKWRSINTIHNDFSGSKLTINRDAYISESKTNERNKAISFLLDSYKRIYFDPLETVDLYTKQCAISISTIELAQMAATLASGGVNPITKKIVVSKESTAHVLSVMTINGLYDQSGSWFYENGIPAKSGVGGGIIAVIPGVLGIAAFSPRLNEYGTSVRGKYAIEQVIKKLNLNPYIINYSEIIKNHNKRIKLTSQ